MWQVACGLRRAAWALLAAALGAVLCVHATAGERPLTPEAAHLLRLAMMRDTSDRFHNRPWSETRLSRVRVAGPDHRAQRLADWVAYYGSSDRHRFRLTDEHGEIGADIEVVGLAVGRSGGKGLWSVSSGLALEGRFGTEWSTMVDITTRVERGESALSLDPYEPDTDRYRSIRNPSVVKTYVTWRNSWLGVSVGRQTAHWGPTDTGGLLLSGHAGPMPILRGDVQLANVRFVALTGTLLGSEAGRDTQIPKFLAARRLEWAVAPWLSVAASEAVVWIGQYDLQFLNPVDIAYLDVTPTPPDTRNLALDSSLPLRGPL